MSFDKPSLKGRALRYLAAREYSRFELEQKLKPFEENEGELKAALDDLEAKGFISQSRVVESVLNQKSPRFGSMRVLRDLRNKGVDEVALADAAATLKYTELDRAREVWMRKYGKLGEVAATPSEWARQARFLAARGFGADVVARVLRN